MMTVGGVGGTCSVHAVITYNPSNDPPLPDGSVDLTNGRISHIELRSEGPCSVRVLIAKKGTAKVVEWERAFVGDDVVDRKVVGNKTFGDYLWHTIGVVV